MLLAAVLTGTVISLTHLIVFCGIDYRDTANVYAAMSRALASGAYSEAFHPAIPSLNVLFSRFFTLAGMKPDMAMSAVSCMFYVATIPFAYLLLKRFLPDEPSAFGAVLFACAPKIIRFSCAGLIDSGKVFFLVAGLYFSCRMIQEKFRSYGTALGFGLALGGLSLARSEGIVNALVLFGCTSIFWLWAAWREKRILPVLPLLSAVTMWALALLSRMWINWRFYGEFVYDARIHGKLRLLFASFAHTSNPAAAPATETAAAAEAMTDGNSAILEWLELLRKNIVGNYEVYFGFAVAGVLLMILADCVRRTGQDAGDTCTLKSKLRILWPDGAAPEFVTWNPLYLVLIGSVCGNIVIFKMSNLHAYRYFLLNIPLFMAFTIMACWWFWRWAVKLLPRPLLGAGIAAVVVILALQINNGVDNVFSGDARKPVLSGMAAGKAMREETPDGRVLFRFACIEWYYTGMKRAQPIETPEPDYRTFSDFDFILVCKDEDEILPDVEIRDDLQEIPLPPESTVRLFRKTKEK